MMRSWHDWRRVAAGIVGSLVVLFATAATATEVVLKDGRILRGRTGETLGLAEQNGVGDAEAIKQIVFVNDDFRLTFVSRRQIKEVRPDTSLENAEKFECNRHDRDRIGHNGRQRVVSVGPPAGPLKEFDDWGRRIYPMRTAGGVLNVVQVITDLTPQYARVEALQQTWDMRIATSTLSDEMLDKILMHQINPKKLDDRKKVVRFYLQCRRYSMAVAALQKILQDFKDDTQVAQNLQPTLQKLRLMYAQQMLDELGLRQESGQHALVQKIFNDFPTEDASGEILQTVRQVQQAYKEFEAKRKAIDGACQALLLQVQERADRAGLATALREMGPGLNPEMLPRMAAFVQNQNDPKLKAEDKLSLAVSGWLLGSDAASTDLPATLSAWRLRGMVQKYSDGNGKGETRSAVAGDARRDRRQAGNAGRAGRPHDAAVPIAGTDRQEHPRLLQAGNRRAPRPAGRDLLRAVAAGVQSPAPLPDDRLPARHRPRPDDADRVVGGRTQGQGPAGPAGTGGAIRIYRHRPGLDRRAPEGI